MITVETERMVLQAMTRQQLGMALHDAEQLCVDMNAVIPPEVFSEESRQAMTIKISRMEHVELHLYPWYTYFLMIRSADRRALGVCGFKGSPTMFGSVELGYAIHETFRNQGLMTEAVRALVNWAFTHDDCQVVTAETLRENIASQRVLQKSGLAMDRATENMRFWKIDREEWERQRAESSPPPAAP